jgi:hypothetical protein
VATNGTPPCGSEPAAQPASNGGGSGNIRAPARIPRHLDASRVEQRVSNLRACGHLMKPSSWRGGRYSNTMSKPKITGHRPKLLSGAGSSGANPTLSAKHTPTSWLTAFFASGALSTRTPVAAQTLQTLQSDQVPAPRRHQRRPSVTMTIEATVDSCSLRVPSFFGGTSESWASSRFNARTRGTNEITLFRRREPSEFFEPIEDDPYSRCR